MMFKPQKMLTIDVSKTQPPVYSCNNAVETLINTHPHRHEPERGLMHHRMNSQTEAKQKLSVEQSPPSSLT